jgi:hypothetical protein
MSVRVLALAIGIWGGIKPGKLNMDFEGEGVSPED